MSWAVFVAVRAVTRSNWPRVRNASRFSQQPSDAKMRRCSAKSRGIVLSGRNIGRRSRNRSTWLAQSDRSRNCDLLLIDCLTLFAGKLLEVHGENLPAIAAGVDALCAALKASPCSVVLVSNEVGSGVVPAFELGRRYRDLLGEINQRVAAIADHVVLMVAGLPLTLKSSLARRFAREEFPFCARATVS